MTSEIKHSFCRVCANGCPIEVHVEDGRAVKVTGDPAGPVHDGYSCHRGRSLPDQLNAPDRLLHSMKRGDDGTFQPIDVEVAMDEIAEQLREIIDQHGSRAVAHYAGTALTQCALGYPLADSLMDAIESPMRFSANTIDQPGKQIAKGMHGYWLAPPQAFDEPDVILWIGINPLMTYTGLPQGNPGHFFRGLAERGARTIVIDPRRTEVARRATLHLQPRPGTDVIILAGFLRVIIAEGLYDREFVEQNVDNLDMLTAAVEPFTVDLVAHRADIDADDLVRAARMFAEGRRGYAVAGTGPNMGTAQGTLLEYLVLALDTLCGHYLRAGEEVRSPGTLLPTPTFKAQAHPPVEAYGFGEPLRFRGLADTLGGMPVAALADEILTPGDGQVRALIIFGGNPVAAFPDQLRTIEAMEALELLVAIHVRMTQTTRRAHYVIAPTMSLEVSRMRTDVPITYANGYTGSIAPVAHYTPAVVDRPPQSQLIEDWELYWGLAVRLGLQLHLNPGMPFRDRPPAPGVKPPLDMRRKMTTDEFFEMMTARARVPLAEVKRHPHGGIFPAEPAVVVQPKDPGWTGRLDVGNTEMMRDLAAVAAAGPLGAGDRPFRLISRRMHQINSFLHIPSVDRGRPYNPAFMHPDDLAALGVEEGDLLEITSTRASITAVAGADPNLRRGLVSMAHCFGDEPSRDGDVRLIGSPANRLLSVDECYERYSGQPLMSNVPIDIRPAQPANNGPSV